MSPTIFREGGYRFFFFSREEPRVHVHVLSGSGEAKFWLQPAIEIATSHGLNQSELGRVREIIEAHREEIREAWRGHFGG